MERDCLTLSFVKQNSLSILWREDHINVCKAFTLAPSFSGQPQSVVTDTGPSIAVSGADFEKSSESVHGTLEQNSTSTVTIAPGRKLTFTSKVEKKYLSVPFTIEVTTSTKKILKGSGTWIGGAYLNTSSKSDASSLDGEDTEE